jgi:AcrR family transcriptional regulator
MTEQNEQEISDRRQQILEAALKVFSTKGFHKATNKDIADAAGGISPGLIYWYFKDKQDLFLSLVRERAPIFDVVTHPERLMDLPPREALGLIGRSFLAVLDVPGNVAMFRIIVGEAMRFPEIGEQFYKMAPVHVFAALSAYFQRQIDLGNFRPHDTAIATRSFIGMFVAHIIVREVMRQPEAIATPNDQVVATAVEIFVRGLEVDRAQPED